MKAKILQVCMTLTAVSVPAFADDNLNMAIDNVRVACGGISTELSDLKTKAGISTAVSAVGTVAGTVALGTGISKSGVDKEASKLEEKLKAYVEKYKDVPVQNLVLKDEKSFFTALLGVSEGQISVGTDESQEKIGHDIKELDELNQKSKRLGNVRTGTMATTAATSIVGAVLSGTNRVKGDLKTQIDACLTSVRILSDVRMQARISGAATDEELSRAENIVRACEEWSTVDVSSINKKATGAAITSGVAAGMGVAGTATSAVANSDKARNGDENKEKGLNTASNVLAGGAAAASLTATILNGVQIKTVKRAATVADECEGALK